ncbi:hypothetical protein CHLRE_07g342700v5 [Chlamydomonas reinhardtii]|nr:uncharacterized protein CHLRE_07g342700v5 [Chlamydomonas reinhardtii]PNW81060.1 hypothetical protein CHLRE_07g342700v5 [Chlamydomonas reinhardtii]
MPPNPAPPVPSPHLPPGPPRPPRPPQVKATRRSRFFCDTTAGAASTGSSYEVGRIGGRRRNLNAPEPGAFLVNEDEWKAGSGLALSSFTVLASATSISEAWSVHRYRGPGEVNTTTASSSNAIASAATAIGAVTSAINTISNWEKSNMTLDMESAWTQSGPDRIVAVSVCCSVSSSNAGDLLLPARLLFRTKGGYAHVLGSGGSRFTGSDDAVLCGYRREDVPQPWEAVPAGFMLGGLVAERAANASTFSRVGFVFVAEPSAEEWASMASIKASPPNTNGGGYHPSVGFIVGVSLGGGAAVLTLLVMIVRFGRRMCTRGKDRQYFQRNLAEQCSADVESVAGSFEVLTATALCAATEYYVGRRLYTDFSAALRGRDCGNSSGGQVYTGLLPRDSSAGDPRGRAVLVWRLEHRSSTVPPPPTQQSGLDERLVQMERAARRLAALRHPTLLPLLGSCATAPMLVYDPGSLEEAQRGFTLADILKKWPEFLEWEHRVVTGYQVAAAMEFLHAQAPPLFCAVPLDAERVIVDSSTGVAKLGFVGIDFRERADGDNEAHWARMEVEDIRALGVLLLRLLTGDARGEAEELVVWVHGVIKYDRQGGGGGGGNTLPMLATLGTRTGHGHLLVWPREVAFAFAELALKCASCNEQDGVPGLRSEVLPFLYHLLSHKRPPPPPPRPPPAASSMLHSSRRPPQEEQQEEEPRQRRRVRESVPAGPMEQVEVPGPQESDSGEAGSWQQEQNQEQGQQEEPQGPPPTRAARRRRSRPAGAGPFAELRAQQRVHRPQGTAGQLQQHESLTEQASAERHAAGEGGGRQGEEDADQQQLDHELEEVAEISLPGPPQGQLLPTPPGSLLSQGNSGNELL